MMPCQRGSGGRGWAKKIPFGKGGERANGKTRKTVEAGFFVRVGSITRCEALARLNACPVADEITRRERGIAAREAAVARRERLVAERERAAARREGGAA